jgi:hypothetical protein
MRVQPWLKGHYLKWASGASRGRNVWLLKRVIAISAIVLGTAGAVALGSVSTARADTGCPSGWEMVIGGTTISCSQTFTATGQEVSFAVPTGVNQFNVTAVGGGQGSTVPSIGSGGCGGRCLAASNLL